MGGTEPVRKKVEEYAPVWCEHANIKFEFVDDTEPADIRVSFVKGNTWSFVGKECKKRPKNEATMNFGWLDEKTDDTECSRTILHEFGHALGCIHEHQSPEAGIEWNDDAVYDHYKGLGWSEAKVRKNIFQRYRRDMVRASKFDPDSIMLYFFSPHFTQNHYAVRENYELSAGDKLYIAKMYPKAGGTRSSEGHNQSPQGGLPQKLDGNPTTCRGYVQGALRNFVNRMSRRFRRNT